MTLTAIVLCGGRSSRMGRDKGTLPFSDRTMIDRVIAAARPISREVIVVSRPDQDAPAGVRVVHDRVHDCGPLAGMAAGLRASHTELNIIVACDMPLIATAVLQRLVEHLGDHDACVAEVDAHASALCGIYRSRVADAAEELLASGERRVMALLDRITTKRVDAAAFRDIDPNLDSFLSCDTLEAYQQALARTESAARRSPGA